MTEDEDKQPDYKKQINELLNFIKVESLNQSYNSINISFGLMLVYINNAFRERLKLTSQKDSIACLLESYIAMANKFYSLFLFSLLGEIKSQRELQTKSDQAVEKINNLPTSEKAGLEASIPILKQASADAEAKYNELIISFPTLLQNALDKLKDEWHRINDISIASQISLKDEKELNRALNLVANAAAYMIGISSEGIVIVPGNTFALYFFSYMDNLSVLTVPIYSMRAPWEWSIFWHELAGYKVRELEKNLTIDNNRDQILSFYSTYVSLKEEEKKSLLDEVTRTNQRFSDFGENISGELKGRKNAFSLDYLEKIFSKSEEPDLTDFGGFEHQFEKMLESLPKKDKFQAYEKIKEVGWCVDWLKELFEDAWSVLAIRRNFLDFFQNVLERHLATDTRHPPLSVRMNVAREILNLTEGSSATDDSPIELIEKKAAQQILKFISLLNVAAHKFDSKDDETFNLRKKWQLSFPDAVGFEIGESINHWKNKFFAGGDQVLKAEEDANIVISKFSNDELVAFNKSLKETENDLEKSIMPSFEKLLNGKEDYRQLLSLSFFERDFFNSTQISEIKFGAKIKPKFKKNSEFTTVSQSVILDNCAVPGNGGDNDITYRVTNPATGRSLQYHTSLTNWNALFPMSSRYYIS